MTSREYRVNWLDAKHKFTKYLDDDGYELLHLTQKFGYSSYSNEIDKTNCLLTCDVMYTDKDGKKRILSNKNKVKFNGRELTLYNDDGTIKYNGWVYMDVTKPIHKLFDIDGNELLIGGMNHEI